ncbi:MULTISPECIES: Lrp/AsnC family transcriptional regulator [Falsihalocynthiibacter]|uniref:AsnC family transcriptional regulator n=1 Tax=Falsihalocynthiibacter arcticus TaxID=1579316 RepID=A0A126V364_9RHOB|nr:Lrp/AsnC family transcriptional regulator [Falsihalocynthiibacter arcticus]AML52758.1 AsnC family transcriptional regulator [Falsihalocynthiibacter arcticus]
MDELDRNLIAALRKNARKTLSELAAELKTSRTTARARMERLVARGDIVDFTVRLREDVAQAPVRGLMMLGIEGRGTHKVLHQLLGQNSVREVHSTNGKWDLIVEINADSLEAFDRVLSDIRRIEGVQTSETNLLLTTRSMRSQQVV